MTDLCEWGSYLRLDGSIAEGWLRIVPPIPGMPHGEMPREVPLSTSQQTSSAKNKGKKA